MLPDDQPSEWFIKSDVFRTIVNALTMVEDKRMIQNEISNVLQNIDLKNQSNLIKPWEGGKVYCAWKINPVVEDLLDNLNYLFIAMGSSIPIDIPLPFFCNVCLCFAL